MNRRDFFVNTASVVATVGLVGGEKLIAAINDTEPLTVENIKALGKKFYPNRRQNPPWYTVPDSVYNGAIQEINEYLPEIKTIGDLRKILLLTDKRDFVQVGMIRLSVNVHYNSKCGKWIPSVVDRDMPLLT